MQTKWINKWIKIMKWIKQSKWNGILQILIMRWVLLLYLWMKIMFVMFIHAFMAGCWCLPINKRSIKWKFHLQHRTVSASTHGMNEIELNLSELLTRSSLLADLIQIGNELGIMWSGVPLSYRTLHASSRIRSQSRKPRNRKPFGFAYNERQ